MPGVQIGVTNWVSDWNMEYDPPPYQAWVRLWGLPFQAWNGKDIEKTTTGLGRITAILPYGRQARHFRSITVRLACEHPRTIQKFVKYHEGTSSCDVRVELLQWRILQRGPYPLHHDASEEQILQQPAQSSNPPPPATPSNNTVTSDNEAGATSGDSGGSHSIHGPTSMVERKIMRWRLKAKVKQKWLHRKKGEERQGTPKVTLVEQIDDTPKVRGEEGLNVSFQREKGIVQIKKGNEVLGWIHLQSEVPCKDSENIQCTVPLFNLSKASMLQNSTAAENEQGDSQGKGQTQIITVQDSQMEQVDKLNEYENSRPEQTSQKADQQTDWDWEINESNENENGLLLNKLQDRDGEEVQWILGLPCGPEIEGQEETSVLQIIEPKQNILPEQEMKTPKQKRGKKHVDTPIRRSARILESDNKKYYGKPTRAKGEKLEIDFQNRTENIEATLAIELVTESGAQVT